MNTQTHANFHVLNHALVQDKMARLRDQNTDRVQFRSLLGSITAILLMEATRDLPLEPRSITTPCGIAEAYTLNAVNPVMVPILRAGLGMLDPALALMPEARVGQIGVRRDEETHDPHLYYFNIPRQGDGQFYFILDPMLATGGTAVMAADLLKSEGIKNIRFICLVAAPEGRDVFCGRHPDVPVYCASLDEHLNASKYIVPGLGDAGDRIFGTE